MKSIKILSLASILLTTAALQAQNGPLIANWGTLGKAGLSMGFAAKWEVQESADLLTGTSPDGQVTIFSYIADGKEVQQVVDNLQALLNNSFEEIALAPLEAYDLNGMRLQKTSGSGKMKDANHFTMEIHVDVLETPINGDNAVVLVVTYGAEETITQYFDDIMLTLNSFKKV